MSKPVALIILDGWGVAPPSIGNAVTSAKTPNFDSYSSFYPAMTLQASGEAVGLPYGEPGNSEVGHMNLGAGRIVYQKLPRITQSIWNGDFFTNKAFLEVCAHVKKNHSKLHLMGLVSSGGVHSYIEHLSALVDLANRQKIKELYIHVFLDGRDTEYNRGINFVNQLQEGLKGYNLGEIATISGRFYAMDRDSHWERIERVYSAMTIGKSDQPNKDPMQAIKDSYAKKIYDEEFVPTNILDDSGKPIGLITDNDGVIFFNFREDRARELTKAFVLPDFKEFVRPKVLKNLFFVTMTEYEKGLPVNIAFYPETINRPLPKILSESGKKQLHVAETEKYAHVTFFFAGGNEKPFKGQDNILVPSPRIPSYAEKPEMSAYEITDKLVKAIADNTYHFIIVNFANPDMVAHTGVFKAGVKAVECVDVCLDRVVKALLAQDGVAVITADHGNVEEMVNLQTGNIDKEHSTNPVPCIIVGKDFFRSGTNNEKPDLTLAAPSGVLADVAPTILKIIGIEKPKEITGQPLI
ncbi:2,3-bisphosphoglycerate-independent phosphoglycerate mutase [Patescibacteria group bacterium]|nr:2,3-bisphosphoglycerate-independent phosphoglycerate mutase [Patescibacteria group bacterium]MBU4511935.1 2,3-bisphosphoglycerate-independent phosphoglycerate mutase [Patescibacteria group bacterium]MCG2692903.1 2,3-bisphosphoglycerate-independent phosphoglycerate mutase [Candidatus Parcubacteria bacterium]